MEKIEDDDFMEVDADEDDGWYDEDDHDGGVYHDPKFEAHDSSYAPKLTSGFQFSIIDEREISDRRQQVINEVKEILGLEDETAQTMLINERFDKDAVIQKTLESSADTADAENQEPVFEPDNGPYLCKVCFCDYSEDELTIGPCGHYLCQNCYFYYLTTAVKSGPQAIRTK